MEKSFFLDKTGDPADRVDGKAKVTGTARYAAEYKPDGLTYGILVTSTIAKGRIKLIDSKKAENMPGVLCVLTHLNRPEVPLWDNSSGTEAKKRLKGQEFRVFYDDRIHYYHQPIALVIADSLERATEAAEQVKVSYQKVQHQTDINYSGAGKIVNEQSVNRGDINALRNSPLRIRAQYKTAIQVHNPMETHAATVAWLTSGKVISYNKTQAVKLAQKDIMTAFNLTEENVEAHSPYVGGAFGSSSRVWPQEMAALLGAKKVRRPVTVMAKRDQVFNMVGYRPESLHTVEIGSGKDGMITGISHHVTGTTSMYEEFTERMTDPTKTMYACGNLETRYMLKPLDMSTPCWTRGPGETSGSFALESAMDELSYALKMDPLAFRLKNFAEKDPDNGKPWSSNYLIACYESGAERFGWNRRNPAPGTMRSGEWLLGMGMSAGIYKANRSPASASASLRADGKLLVQSSVADVGPGSATVMTQIAAEAFGTDVSTVQLEWGNSLLPPAPGQFGSHTTASVGSAVHDAVKLLQKKLKELAMKVPGSVFSGKNLSDLVIADGILKDADSSVSITSILEQAKLPVLKVSVDSQGASEMEKYSGKSFCAHFVEVLVHPATGVVRTSRVVSAIDAGKIMNLKTATSQVYGSVAWAIGIALMEEGIIDHRYGRYVNNNLTDYHLPVNADIPPIDVIFIDKPDPLLDPMGAKGLGEIGLVGLTAAIANAVYHATGKRIRNLPITPDKLL